jgi:hypothetical protein
VSPVSQLQERNGIRERDDTRKCASGFGTWTRAVRYATLGPGWRVNLLQQDLSGPISQLTGPSNLSAQNELGGYTAAQLHLQLEIV